MDKITVRLIFGAAIFISQIIGSVVVIMIWKKDCREYGKTNLAVPLKERMAWYIAVCLFMWCVFLLNRNIWQVIKCL